MDYAPESGTVNFANTQQEAKIYVTILDDTVYEPMEVQFNFIMICPTVLWFSVQQDRWSCDMRNLVGVF